MFLKPYRTLLTRDPEDSKQAWFRQDMEIAPINIINSLRTHLKTISSDVIEYHLAPIKRNIVSGKMPANISFKYADSESFILRDLAFADTIANSFLTKHISETVDEYIQVFFNRLKHIDYFLTANKNPDFNRKAYHGEERYHKSLVINLNKDAATVHDIDYIDIFLDDQHDVIPTNVKRSLCPEIVQRVGIALRIYTTLVESSFEIQKESSVNCSTVGNDGSLYNTISETSKYVNTTFDLASKEYYFKHYCQDMDSVFVEYLKYHKDLLIKKLGYEPTVIDKNTLNLIDMIVI